MRKTTEESSRYNNLEHMSTKELLTAINQEDQTVAHTVAKVIPAIETLANVIVEKMSQGGRLFYLGAGTSGRLGIVDASECPPTYGVPDDWVIGLIAGGDSAIRNAVEFAEDNSEGGWSDLQAHHINTNDVVVGIAASGTTPYVVGALQQCQEQNIITACITCNQGSPLAQVANHPIQAIVGPEFVTGSTRMKSGTAQKLILNMLSTAIMIKLGRVVGNRMVDMQLSNKKLIDRGAKMVMVQTQTDYETAHTLLAQHGSVRAAVKHYQENE